jgi:hypothetical protein
MLVLAVEAHNGRAVARSSDDQLDMQEEAMVNTVESTRSCKTLALAAVLAAALAMSCGVSAQTAAKSAAGSDVQFLSGGVGEGERAKLEEQARGHNLKLVFTMSTGSYLAEIPFQISRGGKTIVEETARGPWAFVKLPAGAYSVTANFDGKTLTKQVSVPKSGQKRLAFVWPATERVAEQPPSK